MGQGGSGRRKTQRVKKHTPGFTTSLRSFHELADQETTLGRKGHEEKAFDYIHLPPDVTKHVPILEALESKANLLLAGDILRLSDTPCLSPHRPKNTIERLIKSQKNPKLLATSLGLPSTMPLGSSEVTALIHGLTYQTGLIQGPPGTRTPLIAAILAKKLYKMTGDSVLILSCTDRALENIFSKLFEIGLDTSSSIAKLDPKGSTPVNMAINKHIMGCTSDALPTYASGFQKESPAIVIVEEAGEILEGYILAILGPNTK
ncbi:hypothetical protein F5Y16DRAFT_377126 [Xylariaceae sp. FL0255]|nr:hypothetical protein F5Y16DRAFT_377126 [Xylariaceae sp. FL0255]